MEGITVTMNVSSFIQETIIQELCAVLDVSQSSINHDLNFPSLGGNSLSAVRLSSRCKKKGVRLPVDSIIRSKSLSQMMESASVLESHLPSPPSPLLSVTTPPPPPPSETDIDWLDQIGTSGVDFRLDLHSWSSSDEGSESDQDEIRSVISTAPTAPQTEVSTTEDSRGLMVQASELQLSLIHGSIKNPGTNIIRHFETYLPEHVPVIKEAWRTIFEQESILRTRFSATLLSRKGGHFDWTEVETDDESQFESWVDTPIGGKEFASTWKVVTLTDVQTGNPVKSVVIWTIHHALIDGYSAQLVLARVRKAAAGEPIAAGPSSAEVSRRLDILRQEKKAEGDAFWAAQKDLQAKAATELQLPKPLEALSEEEEHDFGEVFIDCGVSAQALAGIARRCGVTPAAIHYAAWALVMTVFADNDAVSFGIALSGRNLPLSGIEEAIGPFVNTLPMAVPTKRDMTLGQLAGETFERMTELAEYQWTTTENGFVRNFQSALVMQFDLYLSEQMGSEGAVPTERPYSKQTSDIPLSILVDQDKICFQYKKSDFESSHVENLANLYKQTMQGFLRPDMPLLALQKALVTPEAHQMIQKYGNMSSLTTPASITDDLVTLFERAAEANPGNMAVEMGVDPKTRVTYSQLDERAGMIAQTLITQAGVRPGDVVCVDADRSLNWIVAIMGVLKTGAAYCALDWELPEHLRALMFKQTAASVFLCGTDDAAAKRKPQHENCKFTLVTESIVSSMQGTPRQKFPRRASPVPSSTAYVCFTSGSTGTPKGVICTHEGLVAFQRDLEVRLFAQPGIRVSQVMSPAFDGSIHEIFSAVCHGGTLVLPAPGETVFEALGRANSAILTPSVAEVLDPDDYPSLRYVYLVGEPVKQSVNDRWGAAKMLYNMYGPTEGTCGATIKRLLPGQAVTIGRANPSSRVYILNSRMEHVPLGTVGEICVAGVQVARGYLGLPELTAERFMPDPFSTGEGERLYRTGDRGYWSSNGEVVCLGRNDRQIKMRGFRLDLNDLEIRVALAVPGLKSVAMAPQKDYLVAAIQPSTLDREVVAASIAKVLPVHAHPRHIVLVDEFPMTRQGKLDYKAIVSDDFVNKSTAVDRGELRSPLEIQIATIWRQLLKLGRSVHIGPSSNFFQLGGNSLLQMTLLARLSSLLKAKIPLKVIIESPSLGELASKLESMLKDTKRPVQSRLTLGPRRLSPIEQDWWARYKLENNTTTSAFNVSYVARLEPGSVDGIAMTRAWDTVLSRYSILRGRFRDVQGGRGSSERFYAEHPPRVEKLRDIDIWKAVNRPFDPTRESAIRVFLSADTLAVVMSHIIADLTTLRILLREVQAVYDGETLPPVKHTYEDSVVWQQEAAPCDLKFWSVYLEGYDICDSEAPGPVPATSALRRFGRALPPRSHGYRGTSRVYQLSDSLAASMLAFSAKQDELSLQQLAIAAVGLSLEADRDETDIILGTPFMNRSNDVEMETVGLFLEPLPVRVRHSPQAGGEASARPFLDKVRRSANAALGHAVPWHKLLEHFDITRQQQADPDHALFDVMVTFHHADNAVKLEIPGAVPLYTFAEGSKFSLMIEFTALESGHVLVRVEYDDSQHSAQAVDHVMAVLSNTLSMLLSEVPALTIKESIRREGAGIVSLATLRDNAFGAVLEEL